VVQRGGRKVKKKINRDTPVRRNAKVLRKTPIHAQKRRSENKKKRLIQKLHQKYEPEGKKKKQGSRAINSATQKSSGGKKCCVPGSPVGKKKDLSEAAGRGRKIGKKGGTQGNTRRRYGGVGGFANFGLRINLVKVLSTGTRIGGREGICLIGESEKKRRSLVNQATKAWLRLT